MERVCDGETQHSDNQKTLPGAEVAAVDPNEVEPCGCCPAASVRGGFAEPSGEQSRRERLDEDKQYGERDAGGHDRAECRPGQFEQQQRSCETSGDRGETETN